MAAPSSQRLNSHRDQGAATEGSPLQRYSEFVMPKRKFIAEADADETDYADAECPECGAIVNARFQRGRDWRKLQCPVCRRQVTVSIKEEEASLVQLGRAGAE